MNMREGFRRIARAVALIYWAVAAACFGFYIWNALSDPQSNPFGARAETYWFDYENGGKATILATSSTEADELAKDAYRSPSPGETIHLYSPYHHRATPRKFLEGIGTAFAWVMGVYVILVFIFRGLRWIARGFFEERTAA
jgi:hypothetical protein